jgi:hypothetical protein
MPDVIAERPASRDAEAYQRACGSCSLCCRVLGVAELDKPEGAWCQHCTKSAGCAIFGQAERPLPCRTWTCAWLDGAGTPDDRPDRSGWIVDEHQQTADDGTTRIRIFVVRRVKPRRMPAYVLEVVASVLSSGLPVTMIDYVTADRPQAIIAPHRWTVDRLAVERTLKLVATDVTPEKCSAARYFLTAADAVASYFDVPRAAWAPAFIRFLERCGVAVEDGSRHRAAP